MRYYGNQYAKVSEEVLTRILLRRNIPLEDLGKFGLLIKGKIRDHEGFGTRLHYDNRYISATKAIMHELSKPIRQMLNDRRKNPNRAA